MADIIAQMTNFNTAQDALLQQNLATVQDSLQEGQVARTRAQRASDETLVALELGIAQSTSELEELRDLVEGKVDEGAKVSGRWHNLPA